YDDEGNRLTRTHDTTGDVTEYEWDYRNRLVKVTEKDDLGAVTKLVEYTYDVSDRRIEKSVDVDGAGVGTAAITRYVYDGDHIALEFDGSAASDLTHRYLHGPVVDQILADEVVTSLGSAGTVRWPLVDNLGTVRDIVNSSASVLNHLE